MKCSQIDILYTMLIFEELSCFFITFYLINCPKLFTPSFSVTLIHYLEWQILSEKELSTSFTVPFFDLKSVRILSICSCPTRKRLVNEDTSYFFHMKNYARQTYFVCVIQHGIAMTSQFLSCLKT